MTMADLMACIGAASVISNLCKNLKREGLVDIGCGADDMPEVHLFSDVFYEYLDALHAELAFKYDNKTRPCFYFYGVRVFCVLADEEAAARGYLTEAEAAFYE